MSLIRLEFQIGQAVFAKIKGFPPWPALIVGIMGTNQAKVVYFNSSEYSLLSFKKLTPFDANGKIAHQFYNKNKGFTKAFDELMLVLQNKNPKLVTKKPTVRTRLMKATEASDHQLKSVVMIPKVVLRRMTKADIVKAQLKLKKNKTDDSKRSLRSGRIY